MKRKPKVRKRSSGPYGMIVGGAWEGASPPQRSKPKVRRKKKEAPPPKGDPPRQGFI